MREGSLDPPVRHPIPWEDPGFYDLDAIDAELRRVFDICHGCRRCFNLCGSFPRLFELIDQSESGELDSVDSSGFKSVVDACTLCDMCFMTKCPYVPPHQFNLDFPHLMLRYRAAEFKRREVPPIQRQLTETDRNGRLAGLAAPVANWASSTNNRMTRPILERVAGIDRRAVLPKFQRKTLIRRTSEDNPEINREAPASGRKTVLYATCFANYSDPSIGIAARSVLAKNGVKSEIVYPACCGMPQLEQGDISRVAESARRISAELVSWIDDGYDVVALVPSCALMLKFEWPLILPQDEAVKRLSRSTFDVTEYVVDIAKREGLAPGMQRLDGGVTLHIACHARAQNMGQKATEMMRLIPGVELTVIERCSGHGGSWGVLKANFEAGLTIGRPVARQAAEDVKPLLASECPLAGLHIGQGIEWLGGTKAASVHPIELLARAYGLQAR